MAIYFRYSPIFRSPFSYLDLPVLRFLQQFQQNSLFTNVNLQITTKYSHSDNASIIAQCLSHLLPMIASIDSIELQGSELIDVFIYKCLSIKQYSSQTEKCRKLFRQIKLIFRLIMSPFILT
jgi:hypothetical protein